MKTFLKSVLGVALLTAMQYSTLHAGSTASVTVTVQVAAINELAISGTAPVLTINSATAGSTPNPVSSTGLTYSLTTNLSNQKITGSLDSNMPKGTTLMANLAAPSGATSAGTVELKSKAVDLVTGISTLNASGLALTYTLNATTDAGVIPSTVKTVTLTIVNGT